MKLQSLELVTSLIEARRMRLPVLCALKLVATEVLAAVALDNT